MKKVFFLTLCLLCAIYVSAQNFEPKWVGEVNIIQMVKGDTTVVKTEKCTAQIKTSNSAGLIIVGIGNTRSKIVIKGKQSTTQIPMTDVVQLIVKCKDNESDPSSFIQIVKFEEKKKERKAELANVNWLGNVSEGNMKFMPFNADVYGKTSYILEMPVEEGEYGIRVMNPNEKDEKIILFYCFGIHNN